MNLLVFTQKIDIDDPVLGFFHRWCEKLAAHFTHIHIICLQLGHTALPPNVTVHSLGKESGASRLKYLSRFYRLIRHLRAEYDAVFVHMNPIYIVLGGPFWKRWGKPLYQWYNHQAGHLVADRAMRSARVAFHTSPHAFTARYPNSRRMPAGIDTDRFRPDGSPRSPENLLYVGRIAPIKGVHTLIDAARLLDERGLSFCLRIAGDAEDHEQAYLRSTRELADPLVKKGKVIFLGGVPNRETVSLYSSARAGVNLSPPGLYDKTILEAMACGCLPVVSSRAFADILSDRFLCAENDACDLADKLQAVMSLPPAGHQRQADLFRQYVVQQHNLDRLIAELSHIIHNAG